MADEITQEQVNAWLAKQEALENAEDKRVADLLLALAAQHGREIIAIVQAAPDGSAAFPAWGVRRKLKG